MSLAAPLCIPVQVTIGRSRWFRSAQAVSIDGLLFIRALPDEIDSACEVLFHLPEDPQPIVCHGRSVITEPEAEPPQRRAIRFLDLEDAPRSRIARYLEERLSHEH